MRGMFKGWGAGAEPAPAAAAPPTAKAVAVAAGAAPGGVPVATATAVASPVPTAAMGRGDSSPNARTSTVATGSAPPGSAAKPLSASALAAFREQHGFTLGDRVCAASADRLAVVRFIGETHFATDVWVGLELDHPDGKNDGTYQGVKYFPCGDKKGVFLKPDKVKLAAPGGPQETLGSVESFLKSEPVSSKARSKAAAPPAAASAPPAAAARPVAKASASVEDMSAVASKSKAPPAKAKAKAGAGAPAEPGVKEVNFNAEEVRIAIGTRESHGLDATESLGAPLELRAGLEVAFMGTGATIRYLGPLKHPLAGEAEKDFWIGLEMHDSVGRSDGTFCGVRYFQCAASRALFTQAPADGMLHSMHVSSVGSTAGSTGGGSQPRRRLVSRASTAGLGEILVHDEDGNEELSLTGLAPGEAQKVQAFFDEFARQMEEKEKLLQDLKDAHAREEALTADLKATHQMALRPQAMAVVPSFAGKDSAAADAESMDLTSRRKRMFDVDLSKLLLPKPPPKE